MKITPRDGEKMKSRRGVCYVSKPERRILTNVALAILLSAALYLVQAQEGPLPSPAAAASLQPFLGRWDLAVKGPDGEYPSWFELQQQDGQLKGRLQGRRGGVQPFTNASFSNGILTFGLPKYHWSFEAKLVGAGLAGTATGPKGIPMTWVGRRAPSLERTKAPKWGRPIQLFNGRDLTGWKMDQPGPPVWTVQNGTLVSPGHGPELIHDGTFTDFKLHIEFNCGKKSNSGIFLRGRYEVQIENDSPQQPPSHHTAGVYGYLAPSPELPRTIGEWQTFDITLIGRKVTVVQNGTTVIDNLEIPGITGGALDSNEALPGPIYLQGSEPGQVAFRNIVLIPAR
jgi:hypothetical protein